jgi:two-component system, chemotaxis family, chemotaxis protein CheY
MALTKVAVNDLTALVIEDDDAFRTLVVRLLTAMGFAEVWEASDGGQGLGLAVQKKPTIITCDLEMDPVDGVMFLGGLRASRDAELASTPVVIFTAHKSVEVVERIRAIGAQDYIVKPVKPDAFSEKINAIVEKRVRKLASDRLRSS